MNNVYDEKFMKALEKYYKLKNTYDTKYNKHKKIIRENEAFSLKKKQKLIKAYKTACIKCKRNVGTIFSNSGRILSAKCGDTITPCALNIQLNKGNIINEVKTLEYWENEMKDDKFNMIITKLNFLFQFVERDVSLTKFEEFKSLLNDTLSEYTSTIDILTESEETISDIKNANESLNVHMKTMQETINNFKETNDNQLIKDTVEIYIGNVLPLLEIIKKLNYKVYKINYDEDNETYNLIKQRNTISSIERTLDEDPKIIEYKL